MRSKLDRQNQMFHYFWQRGVYRKRIRFATSSAMQTRC